MTTTEAKKFIAALESVKKYAEFLDEMVKENYQSAKMIQKLKFPEISINEYGLDDSYNIEFENGLVDIDEEISKLNVIVWTGEIL